MLPGRYSYTPQGEVIGDCGAMLEQCFVNLFRLHIAQTLTSVYFGLNC
jgi:hypothetical protein